MNLPIIFILLYLGSITCFEDVTNKAFVKNNNGILAAFGDFNSDKKIDVFQIVDEGKTVEILVSQQIEPFFLNSTIKCSVNEKITSVVPGDYNGDSRMDILITTKASNGDKTNVYVFWGDESKTIICNENITATLRDQPLILDYNSDMIIDFLGEEADEKEKVPKISVWLGTEVNNTFSKIPLSQNPDFIYQKLKVPHSSAFIDLNNDLVADIFLTGENNIEYWINENGIYTRQSTIEYPPGAKKMGQITFSDMNADGYMEALVPVCYDKQCKNSSILGLNNQTWETIVNSFISPNQSYGFRVPDDANREISQISIKISDMNMDGYPDIFAVLEGKGSGPKDMKLVLLKNEPCEGLPCLRTRTFVPFWDTPTLHSLNKVQYVAFYDFYNDGIVDLLAVTKEDGKWKINAFVNHLQNDACFIKVLVLSGRCYPNCPSGSVAYGTNQPGPMVKYNTVKPNGKEETAVASQLFQSAYLSLQLPYCLFGLGQTPNFVERLGVTLPQNTTSARHREWTQIIPNSQIVVVPYPPTNPNKWVFKLFVTPSHLVIMTAVALLGTCGIIAIIIGILHLKEKGEDRKEKLQEAHRFNFDAM